MKNRLHYITGTIALLALVFSLIGYFQTPKIGFVDFKRLVNEFQGMKDAMVEYEDKMKEWNGKADSLSNEIRMELTDYYADSAFISKDEMIKREAKIISMRNQFMEFSKGLDVNAQQEDGKMTAEVVNQVLNFTEKYGVENGYDAILGRNEGNYVLYKSVKNDITDELLKELNLNYNGN